MPSQENYDMEMILKEREMKVSRSLRLVQFIQYTLNLSEQRFLRYCISKVKPTDTPDTTYTIHLQDYFDVCGIKKGTSFHVMKEKVLKTFQQMVFQVETEDEAGNISWTVTNWYDHITVTHNSGTVSFSFSNIVAKELVGLAQYNALSGNKLSYISDELKYSLPFRSRYSFYLYDLLRSYQNRNSWIFKIEELREALDVYERLSDVKDYSRVYSGNNTITRTPIHEKFAEFRKCVLNPAVDDINQFSNIKVVYRPIKKQKRVVAIEFIFEDKSSDEKLEAEQRGRVVLDQATLPSGLVAPRTVEPPIEFNESHDTGEDTTPKSVTVKKRKTKKAASVAEMAACVQESLMESGQEDNASAATDDVPYLGKKVSHKSSLGQKNGENSYFFPIVETGTKMARMETDLGKIRELGEKIGEPFSAWCNTVTPKEFIQFFRHCVATQGSVKLQQYSSTRYMKYGISDQTISIDITGKTTADALARFIARVFGNKEACIAAFASFQEKERNG